MSVRLGLWRRFWHSFRALPFVLGQCLTRGSRRKRRANVYHPPRRIRAVEVLEPRRMMSVTSYYTPSDYTLHVNSDAAYETVQVGYVMDGSDPRANVTTNYDTIVAIHYDSPGGEIAPPLTAEVQFIEIEASGGQNTIDLRGVAGSPFSAALRAAVDAQGGTDVVYASEFWTDVSTYDGSNSVYGGGNGSTTGLYGGGTNTLYDGGGTNTLYDGAAQICYWTRAV